MFELTLSRNHLLNPLLAVAGAVDKKQSLAILSNILLYWANDQLRLTATDLEMEITARIDCASHGSSAKITVPAKKFIDIMRSLDEDATPTISSKAGTVIISCGRSQFKLATLPAEDFPSSDNDVSDIELTVARQDLIHLLQSTHFAMSQHDVRIFLNGLLLELDSQVITAVATDGHRMAVCRLPCDAVDSHQRFLLPRKSVQEMLRLLNSIEDEHIAISAGKGHFKLDSREFSFQSRLIEARFPPYAKAIPKQQDKFVLVDRDLLKRALSRIMILAHEKSRAVILHMQSGTFTLIANNQEQEEATETLEAHTDGNEIKIGINASYLLDVLNYFDEGLVRLSMSAMDSSILVESLQDEQYQYIIMPMKL
ncbi:DNA polymerase III subunit beta [Legionella jordanis]|uniref:Beta sliding clamp n=1 Tax=Legionella jordanis TaxID=456 RepID=A0A0W0VCK3_9GAMM|nr:DNA polymerase III subunit beta [Legionella jordanis]KTD17873.1 DNA polymerase III, beta chain [Legionella jordanis]RMX02428.1 DNA polymerase III subunit beta [Legionella jordanis]RMX21729.1 DNA polymerase III subunit beta [Legionella jordanis]VEH11187.1 DNA polymerase III subunit beta [Legionella jordanis]HAT8713843.1 DNA polymerase III subunit beta [Legionella jordanis]